MPSHRREAKFGAARIAAAGTAIILMRRYATRKAK